MSSQVTSGRGTRRFAPIAGAVVSIALLAALVELTVETVFHRSPLAFAAVVTVTVYALFTVFAWRRADGIAHALAGLAALGAVLACDDAHFGTLAADGGVSLLGVDANTLAAALLLVLSLVAVAFLASWTVPAGWKIAVACIFAYACTPIGFAMLQKTGLSSALATNAPLAPGPFWLRGAYLAPLVLLPLSAMVALALAMMSIARKRFSIAQRALAAAVAFALATQVSGLEAAHAGLPALALGAAPAVVGVDPAQKSSQLANVPESLAASVANVAARIGDDPAALLARVSNGVAYEIYPGVFRGAAATLTDGAGNDFDKALLLHDLMHAANASAVLRFASCTLDSQQAEALVGEAERSYHVPVLAAQRPRANAPTFQNQKLAEAYRNAPAIWRSISTQAHEERAALQSEIASTGGAFAPSPASARALDGIVARHVWLQVQRDGTWIDLDPTRPDAKPGVTLCSAQSTFESIADDDYDTISAVARVERRKNGALDEQPAVRGTWRTADLGDGSLTFAFAEPTGLLPAPKIPRSDGMLDFTPVFVAGSTITAGAPIVVPAPPKQTSAGALGVSGALSDVNSTLAGSSTPTPAPSAAASNEEVTRVAIAFTVAAPGIPSESSDAAVFDRVGFADRAAGHAAAAPLAPLADANMQYSRFSEVWNIAVAEGTGMVGVGDHASAGGKKTGSLGLIAVMGTIQRSYGTLRRAIFADLTGGGAPAIDNALPGVNVMAATWAPSGANAKPAPTLAMNVVADHARPRGPDTNAALSWAVSSLMAERTVVSSDRMMEAVESHADPAAIGVVDVFSVFAAAQKSKVASALVRSDSDIAAALPADVKARLASSLEGGQVALAPTQIVAFDGSEHYGWWNLRPDGSVVDEMASGGHQTIPEEAGFLTRIACAFPRFAAVGRRVAAVAVVTMAIQGVGEGGEAAEESVAEAQYEVLEEEEAAEIEEATEAAAEAAC
jgi:hypothetical protein